MTAVKAVALVYQTFRPETRAAAQQCATYLEQRKVRADLLPAFELARFPVAPYQLVVAFGGDGTALRASAWVGGAGTPIVPVRMGKLSFLAAVSPADLPEALGPMLDGHFRSDERIMLTATCDSESLLGLNDVVVGRGAASRAVRLDVYVDRELLGRYTADGIVVATPTGSTAYALAAGGPVVAPSVQGLVLVPIAPHLTQLRALVLPADVSIRIVVHTVQPAVLTVDGHRDVAVSDGEEVCVRVAPQTTRFARLAPEAEFYRSLESRLTRRE